MNKHKNFNIYRNIILICSIIVSLCFVLVLALSIKSSFDPMNILLLFLTFSCSMLTWSIFVIKKNKNT